MLMVGLRAPDFVRVGFAAEVTAGVAGAGGCSANGVGIAPSIDPKERVS